MDWSEVARIAFMSIYTLMLAMVSLYGFHRYLLVFLYYRHRKNIPTVLKPFDVLPLVTIQLPMFNEHLVAKRIIEKTCEVDYPKDRLQIQVLDDSTDDTCQIAEAAVAEARAKGFDIEYVHRDNREGYKAGALQAGMKSVKGEFISIFDADFIPDKDYLKRSIHYFSNPKVCVVQTRWDHLNRNDSLLTRTQAIFLDGHFAIEHVARNRSERFMSFNGTAGTWRKTAIADAGGWHHDTLTEDLDLSYRAQMKGWKFVFLPELTAPAELPPEMNAFKAQQFRWTKGGAQVAIKLLPKVFMSKEPLKVKIEAFFHLTNFSMHLFMLVLVLLMFPAMNFKCIPLDDGTMARRAFDIGVFMLATLSAGVFYGASQYELTGDWRMILKYMPMMMALGVGLCVSNTKAILEALFGKKSEFVRTPKYGDTRNVASAAQSTALPQAKKKKRNYLPHIEFVLGLYMAVCTVWSLRGYQSALATPFLAIFTFGFFYVSVTSFMAMRASSTSSAPAPVTVEKQ